MRPLLARVLQHDIFAFVGRREGGVAAFAAERDPAVVGGNQAGYAHAGARAQQADHTVRPARAAAYLHALRVGQAGQRHGQRGKVVHDQQRVEAQRAARGFDRKAPVVIGHADVIAVDRVRNRNRRVVHAADLDVLQILLDDFGNARIVPRTDTPVLSRSRPAPFRARSAHWCRQCRPAASVHRRAGSAPGTALVCTPVDIESHSLVICQRARWHFFAARRRRRSARRAFRGPAINRNSCLTSFERGQRPAHARMRRTARMHGDEAVSRDDGEVPLGRIGENGRRMAVFAHAEHATSGTRR